MKIVEIARKYVGQKEIPGNKGFLDKKFEEEMKKDGWRTGEAWCCYFQEMIWEEAYPEFEKEFDRLFSANCVQTLNNFQKEGYGISTLPFPGSLCIMQRYVNGQATSQGHALLVTNLTTKTEWFGIEGNTNEAGSREGEVVAEKKRSMLFHPQGTGLRVAGFVLIRETLRIDF